MALSIPQAAEADIAAKASEGWSTRKIAAWLASERQLDVSHHTVARYLAKTKGERADLVKTVVREKLQKTVGSDLDILSRHVQRLDRLARRFYGGTKTEDPDAAFGAAEGYVKVTEQLRKVIDTRLHYSGADQTDQQGSEMRALGQRAFERAQRMIADAEAAAKADGAGAQGEAPDEPDPSGGAEPG